MPKYTFEDFQTLIDHFHEKLGLEPAPLDSNMLFMELEDIAIVLEFMEDAGAIVLWSEVTEMPGHLVTPEIQEKALGINMLTLFSGGGALSYNEFSKQFLFAQPISVAELTVEALEAALRAYLAGAKLVGARMEKLAETGGKKEPLPVAGNRPDDEVILSI